MKKKRLAKGIRKIVLRKETVRGLDDSTIPVSPSHTKGSGNSECDCGTANTCITNCGCAPPPI